MEDNTRKAGAQKARFDAGEIRSIIFDDPLGSIVVKVEWRKNPEVRRYYSVDGGWSSDWGVETIPMHWTECQRVIPYVTDGRVNAQRIGKDKGREALRQSDYVGALLLAAKMAEQDQDEPKTTPPPKVAPSTGDPIRDYINERVDARVGEIPQGIDTEAVEAIVDAKVEDLRPRITEVKVGARPVVEIKGRTHKDFEKVLFLLQHGRKAPMLIGPAGSGKTTLAIQLAEALGIPFYGISMTAQTPVSSVIGYKDANGVYREVDARKAFEGSGLFLIDEMDAGNPNAQAAFHMMLANGKASFPDRMVARHNDCYFVAAANTYGHGANALYVGRNQLDAATLDRFTRFTMGYDEDLETEVAAEIGGEVGKRWARKVQTIRRNAEGLRVVVSPRATEEGAALLSAEGTPFTEADVAAMTLTDGQPAEVVDKMLHGVTLAAA